MAGFKLECIMVDKQTNRHTGRKADRQEDREAGRHVCWQADIQADGQTETHAGSQSKVGKGSERKDRTWKN